MSKTHRRGWVVIILLVMSIISLILHNSFGELDPQADTSETTTPDTAATKALLDQLQVKGRAPKTGYERAQFGDGWTQRDGCDMRNIVLARDLQEVVRNEKCQVVSGILYDPYTGKVISFTRGALTSDDVQIDHVVALSNAWQTGAQQLTLEQREQFANDDRNLLAVDGEANQQKSDGDAATWLPQNKSFRCEYVTRQIEVKSQYGLWVTSPEKQAIIRVLAEC